MLESFHEFTIARFASWEEVDFAEVGQADLVQVLGQHEGGIYHSRSIFWEGDLNAADSALSFIFTKKDRKATSKQQAFFAREGFEVAIVPLTIELYEQFLEIYRSTTLQKSRAAIFDVESIVRGRILAGSDVRIVGLFKDNQLQSGLIFSTFNQVIAVHFGAKQRFAHIPGGIGGLFEYVLLKLAYESGYTKITHGRGQCPTGLVSGAGLFAFKARYGFSAYPDGAWVTSFVRNPDIFVSDAIFVTIADNQLCYRVLAREPNEELLKRYRTRAVRAVQLESMVGVVEQHRAFLTQAAQMSREAAQTVQ